MSSFADTVLPAINGSLNAISATLVLTGWRAIKRKNVTLHRRCMKAAIAASALFLVCYVIRASLTGTHRFEGPAAIRMLYLVVLFSHMTLAVLVVPLVGRTAYLAIRGRLDEHRRIARVTLPIWLYVSVTGVLIYILLYHVSGRIG